MKAYLYFIITLRRCFPVALAGLILLAPPTFAAAAHARPGSDLLIDAKAALEDGLYVLAQKKIEQYLRIEADEPAEQLEGALRLAQAFYGQKRYQDSLDLLAANRAAAAASALNDSFELWMAMAYFELKQWSRSLELLNDFEEKYPSSPWQPQVLRLRAWSLLKLEQHHAAIECFARFADLYGNSPEGPVNLLDGSKALLAAGQNESARTVLEKLMVLAPADRIGQEGRNLLSRLYLTEGSLAQARRIVLPLIEQKNVANDLRAAAFFTLADIAATQADWVAALSLLDKCAGEIAEPAIQQNINLRKGQYLLKMGKTNEGITVVRRFVSEQRTNAAAAAAQLELAQILLDQGLNDKALSEFQNYLETFLNPVGQLQAYQGQGWALLNLGRNIEAALVFEKAYAVALTPEAKAQSLIKAADSRFIGEQYSLALATYAQVIAQFPDSVQAEQARLQMAECQVNLGNLAAGELTLWEAADEDGCGPLAAQALLRIAELYSQQGRENQVRIVSELIQAECGPAAQARALFILAALDYRQNRFAEALAELQLIAGAFPKNQISDQAAYLSAWCYSRLGRHDEALAAFRSFIDSYPSSSWAADASFWLAEQDYNQGLYDQAETSWIKLARNYPQSSWAGQALFWAGRAAMRQNEFRRAKDYFALFIRSYPSSAKLPEARFYQGESLCELGEYAGAILIFDEIIQQFPNSDLVLSALLRKGDSQFALGAEDPRRYEEALRTYQRIMPEPQEVTLALLQAEYKIGRCLEKMGRTADAFDYYMKVVYAYFKHSDLQPRANIWFTRAAFNAAAIKEKEKSWRKAAAIYQRVVDAQVAASQDAQERIHQLQTDYWMLFY